MKVVEMKVNELVPYENNPRDNADAVAPVAESIKNFGFKVPIVIDSNNVIVTGHTRLAAAKKLGLETVPCVIADDLSPAQVKAFRIADNKVAEQADWDFDRLQKEMNDLKNFDWTQFGFNDFEIGMITEDVFDVDDLNRDAYVTGEAIDVTDTKLEPKKSRIQQRAEEAVLNSIGQIKCPCCGEYFDFDKSMLGSD